MTAASCHSACDWPSSASFLLRLTLVIPGLKYLKVLKSPPLFIGTLVENFGPVGSRFTVMSAITSVTFFFHSNPKSVLDHTFHVRPRPGSHGVAGSDDGELRVDVLQNVEAAERRKFSGTDRVRLRLLLHDELWPDGLKSSLSDHKTENVPKNRTPSCFSCETILIETAHGDSENRKREELTSSSFTVGFLPTLFVMTVGLRVDVSDSVTVGG